MPSETFTPLDDRRDTLVETRSLAEQPAPAWPAVGPEGEPAPRFVLPDQGGQAWNVTGDPVAGKPMVLLFCRSLNSPAVLEAVGRFGALYERFAEREATVAMITRQTTSINAEDRGDQAVPFRLLADTLGDVTRRYRGLAGGSEAPLLVFVLTPSLRVARCFAGPECSDQALNVVDDLLAEREAAPIGCHAPVLQIPDVLSKAECRYLVALHGRSDVRWNEPGDPEDQYDFKIRVGDHRRVDRVDYVINDPVVMKHLDARLARRIRPEIRKAFQYKVTKRETFHLACYQGQRGGFSIGHRDNPTQDLAYRRFALSINLNEGEYEGGELRFREYGEQRYRVPTGTALVFSSSQLHEAMAVTSGRRFVLLSHLFGEDAEAEPQELAQGAS
jgi:peroxiredoxin/predicted 2-oxoglutarate/Fe(II)-dependent dioxygenase YbiX